MSSEQNMSSQYDSKLCKSDIKIPEHNTEDA